MDFEAAEQREFSPGGQTPEISIGAVQGKGEANPFIPKFEEFYNTHYKKQIEKLVREYPQKRSLEISFKDLENFDFQLADELIEHPDLILEGARLAAQHIDIPALEIEKFAPNIRIMDLPGDRQPLVRDVSSKHLGKLFAVEGVIRQLTDVLPKLKMATWRCKRCGNTYVIEQVGHQQKLPGLCSCKHKDFELIPEDSSFVDYQKIQIQEPLEMLKGSEQAVNLDIYIDDDFVNRIAPGDRTRMTGILRLYPPSKDKKNVYNRYLEAVHIEETEREFEDVNVTEEEEQKIKDLAANPKIYEMLRDSIAPNIFGHDITKEAVSLQLFGGVKKALPDGTSIRGNIHVLLVGDPGTAKSMILMAADRIAPKSVYVAGKTSTSAGLCVAPETMILNDSGFKPIQEFVEESFDETKAIEEIPGAYANPFDGSAHALTDKLDFTFAPIEKIWRIKAPEKMYQLKTRMGKELSLTPATTLIRMRNGQMEWVSANELQEGDFIATPRKLPEGNASNVLTFIHLLGNENTKVGNEIAEWMKAITDKLIPKYGSLQNIAKSVGKSRNTLYSIRNPKFFHGWELDIVVKLAREAGYSDEAIAEKISIVFNRHGNTIHFPKYMDNEDFAYFVGVVLGDGSFTDTKDRTIIRVCGDDPQIIQESTRILKEQFNIIPEYSDDGKKVPEIRFCSVSVGKILKAWGLNNEKQHNQLSHLATEMPNHILKQTLQGLFDTDGYAAKHKNGSVHVGISSISPKLADSIHLALLKFGIVAKKRLRKKAGKTAVGKKITVTSKHDAHVIEITGKENLERFQEQIGFRLTRKQHALNSIIQSISRAQSNVDIVPGIVTQMNQKKMSWRHKSGRNQISHARLQELTKELDDEHALKKLANGNIFWDQIKTKNEFKPDYEWVYDFTVKEHHNFIANGIYVHNTATAVKDDFGEGGWTLKAGALVLASGGMVMVDEFDKMEPEDRSAMHEAMEQGKISVAKAGMVTRFRTDTSVLAAANPKHSRFDSYKPFFEQVDLPPSLISRFDLFFMIRDVLDKKKDEAIAAHILGSHRAGQQLLQHARGKHISNEELQAIEKKVSPIISNELLSKYISYARQHVFPILTADAIQLIQDFYVNLRDSGRQTGSYTATHRQLEGLVRLSEASARIRLSDEVTIEDAERAIRLVRTSLEDVVKDPTTGKIDIDIITTGTTSSTRDHMRQIEEIIKSKSKEMDKVPVDDVIGEAISRGIDENKAREIISKLKKSGEIYEPSHGFLKGA